MIFISLSGKRCCLLWKFLFLLILSVLMIVVIVQIYNLVVLLLSIPVVSFPFLRHIFTQDVRWAVCNFSCISVYCWLFQKREWCLIEPHLIGDEYFSGLWYVDNIRTCSAVCCKTEIDALKCSRCILSRTPPILTSYGESWMHCIQTPEIWKGSWVDRTTVC